MSGIGKIVICLEILILAGCASPDTSVDTVDGQKVYTYDNPKVQEPSFARNQLEVRSVAKKQVQRDDFNGIFYLTPDEVMIVQDYWSREFNRLTQPGAYGKFFNEFNLQMKKLSTYYGSEPQKERMMASAERSFYEFCLSMEIETEYREWRSKMSAW